MPPVKVKTSTLKPGDVICYGSHYPSGDEQDDPMIVTAQPAVIWADSDDGKDGYADWVSLKGKSWGKTPKKSKDGYTIDTRVFRMVEEEAWLYRSAPSEIPAWVEWIYDKRRAEIADREIAKNPPEWATYLRRK